MAFLSDLRKRSSAMGATAASMAPSSSALKGAVLGGVGAAFLSPRGRSAAERLNPGFVVKWSYICK